MFGAVHVHRKKGFWALDGSSVGEDIFGLWFQDADGNCNVLKTTKMKNPASGYSFSELDLPLRNRIITGGGGGGVVHETMLKWLPKAAEQGDCFEILAATWWLLYWKVFKANCRSCKWHLMVWEVDSVEKICDSGEMHESSVKDILNGPWVRIILS